MPQANPTRQQLRQTMRHHRQQLNQTEQDTAAQQLLLQLKSLHQLQYAQHIALYLSFDGEINTRPIIEWLWQQGKKTYLPVLHPFSPGHLLFLNYEPHTPMVRNCYGIQEPKLDIRQLKLITELDIIMTPLVAFDSEGQRLGMGGGFYDRTLSQHQIKKVQTIGLAHDCQYVPQLPVEVWDIPLNCIVSPSYIHHAKNNQPTDEASK